MQIIVCIIKKMEYSTGKDENNLPEDMEKTTCMSWNKYWLTGRATMNTIQQIAQWFLSKASMGCFLLE